MPSQQHKARLLEQSSAYRRTLATQAQNLRPLADYVDAGLVAARKVRGVARVVSLLLAFWPADKRHPPSFAHKLLSAVNIIRLLVLVMCLTSLASALRAGGSRR